MSRVLLLVISFVITTNGFYIHRSNNEMQIPEMNEPSEDVQYEIDNQDLENSVLNRLQKRQINDLAAQRANNLIPRSSLLISGRGFMPGFFDAPRGLFLRKRSADDGKRSVRTVAAIPRSGLMIGGRGWMPGFADNHNSYGMLL